MMTRRAMASCFLGRVVTPVLFVQALAAAGCSPSEPPGTNQFTPEIAKGIKAQRARLHGDAEEPGSKSRKAARRPR
jgi:hypothetical protein